MKRALCLLHICISFLFSKADYILYEVIAFNPHEREILYYLHVKKSSIIFMNSVSNEAAIPMDVIVEKEISKVFEFKLRYFDIQFTYVAEIFKHQLSPRPTINREGNITNAFYDWTSILHWLDNNSDRNYDTKNDVTFNKIVIGRTFENRDIFILKISKGPTRPIVFIVGGEDGKDWISSAVILNVLNELLDGTNDLSKLLKLYDFYLLPILNPDGFVYSRENDRLWSKNRQVKEQKKCNGSSAIGVNIDRNWFLQKSTKRHKSLSEEETQTLSYVLNSVSLNMIAFINVRGFGRYITVPYAMQTENSNNRDIVMEILKLACTKVFEKYNGTFYYDTTASFFCNVADWVKIKLNTPLVFTVYLEDVNTVLPLPQHILPLSKEFYTILYESLTISKQMYGPLFNGFDSSLYSHLQIRDTISYLIKITTYLCLLVNVTQY